VSADDLDDFLVHTATVRTLTGQGGMGKTFAAPVEVPCFADDKRRLVRGPDAVQVVSESTIYTRVEQAARLTPGSEVVLPSGRTAVVITAAARTSGPLDLPDHVEAALT
jgi:hypothetical protein